MRETKSRKSADITSSAAAFTGHVQPQLEPPLSFPVEPSQDKLIIKIVEGRKTEYEGRFLVTKQMLSAFADSLNSLLRQGGKTKLTLYVEAN